MKKWLKNALIIISLALVLFIVVVAIITRNIAVDMINDPVGDRDPIAQTPADFGIEYEDVVVTNTSGLNLVGWYVPSQNGAVVILQHGYEENRQNMLEEADILYRHGYGVLLSTVRGHDQNDEDMITFGCREMEDMEAWYRFVLGRAEIDPERIGILGQSLGGSLAIQFSRENQGIAAVVAHSPLTSMADTVDAGLRHFSPIPDPLVPVLAPFIVFWGERITGCELEDINAKEWIGNISPRPVYLVCGGKDQLVSEKNCRALFSMAREPKEFWFEAECDHHECDTIYPEEFERRVIGFFDQHLVDK